MGSRRSTTNVPPSSRLCRRPRYFVTVDLLSGQRRVRVLDWRMSAFHWYSGRCGPEQHPVTGRRVSESRSRSWTPCCQPRSGMSAPYLDFQEAGVPSSATTSTSAAARAAHSASGSASVARVVTGEERNQTTSRFYPRPRHDTRRGPRRANMRTRSMARRIR